MAIDIPSDPQAGILKPVQINTEEAPWTVSVAENPDAVSLSIYVKTPTHLLTLTRTLSEINDLHNKLASTNPNTTLPTLPAVVRSAKPPRKSSFLTTLSRFGAKTDRSNGQASKSNAVNDVFVADAESDGSKSELGALPAYLTTVANHPVLRDSRPWKRFVHVRMDDLQSARVERTIKRVRSDVAGHSISTRLDSLTNTGAIRKQHTPTQSPRASKELDRSREPSRPSVSGVQSQVSSQPGSSAAPASQSPITEVAEDGEDMSTPVLSRPRTQPLYVEGLQAGTASAAGADAEPTTPKRESSSQGSKTGVAPAPPSMTASASDATSLTDTSRLTGSYPTRSTLSTSPEPDSLDAKHGVDSAAASSVNEPPQGRAASFVSDGKRKAIRELDTDAEVAFDTDIEHPSGASVSGSGAQDQEITASIAKDRKKRRTSKKVTVSDFEMVRVLGKGCAGKVLLVKYRASGDTYALKAITKRHVLAHQELQHTLTEQAVLKRMSREGQDPFVVKLWWSFHDKDNLFLVMDFHPGGDLATQLARWGRLGRDRARFYAAEIVEGVEGLHAAGVIYRDLKPENILIGADGHIVLTDFGLSKEFPRHQKDVMATAPATPSGGAQGLPRWMSDENLDAWKNASGTGASKDLTGTFCGTAEYLAPEVIQGLQYSYEVDWWSFGTMLYEMLSGITPFWANNHSDMYVRVLQDELKFPEDRAMDQDTKSLLRGLLQRNPALRIREPRIKRHPYFSMIDWSHVYYKRYIPPYIPPIDPHNATDTQNFDDAFLDMNPTIDDGPEAVTDSERSRTEDEPTDGETQTPAGSVTSDDDRKGVEIVEDDAPDLFDGYSFKGRSSMAVEEEEEADEDDGDETDEVRLGSDIDGADGADEASDLPAEDIPVVTGDDVSEISIKASQRAAAASQEAVDESKPPSVVDMKMAEPTEPIEPTEPEKPATVQEEDRPLEELVSQSEMYLHAAETPLPPSPSVQKSSIAAKRASIVLPVAEEVHAPSNAPTNVPPARQSSVIAKPPRRREKSGIPELDRFLESDDEVAQPGATADASEDEDWDFVEKDGREDINGPTRPTSLWARGVVDRYKLAVVFRKTNTPNSRSRPRQTPSSRVVSSQSIATAASESRDSPSPSQKRGRGPGLSLRKSTKQFLRAKSPIPFSTPSPTAKRSLMPSPAQSNRKVPTIGSTAPILPPLKGATSSPSLRSKASGLSRSSGPQLTSPSSASDPSLPEAAEDEPTGQMPSFSQSAAEIADGESRDATLRGAPKVGDEAPGDKTGTTFNRKIKVGAERVMSLFVPNNSNRQHQNGTPQAPPAPAAAS